MNLETFNNCLAVMCDALPCTQQERRVSALYEFFGQKDFARVSDAAKMAANEAERFPTPRVFGEFYSRTAPKQQAPDLAAWRPKPSMSDQELADKCVSMGPQKLYRGVLALGATASTVPFMQRMTAMLVEILGPKEVAKIQSEHNRATLDLRIFERKSRGERELPTARNSRTDSTSVARPFEKSNQNGG